MQSAAIPVCHAWGPSVQRSLRSTLPGACIAVVTWLVLSSALGLYLRSFTRLNKTYGTLAAGIALMLWLYWTAFSLALNSTPICSTRTPWKSRALSNARSSAASSRSGRLVSTFQQKGLAGIVNSWVGTGAHLSLNADRLRRRWAGTGPADCRRSSVLIWRRSKDNWRRYCPRS